MQDIGKLVITLGFFLILIGGVLIIGAKFPFFGKLPGDIYIKKGNFTFFFPITTMIILSVVISVVLNIFKK